MADRYWVGGAGTWNATTTTNWATSSGGAGGASAPTSADNVIFDANSNTGTGAFTVTVAGTSVAPSVCNDFSTGGAGGALDGAMTLALSSNFLNIYGSLTLPASNFSATSVNTTIGFLATTTGKTITTNGVTLPVGLYSFNGAGGGWTLGSAFTSTSSVLTVIQGTFDTGNFNITTGALTTTGVLTRTINLGSSTIALSGVTAINLISTGLTWNAGTSQLNLSSASPTFNGGGLTLYNVSFTSTAISTVTITGANTYNNLTFAARAAAGLGTVNIAADQTVSGTLTLGSGTTGVARLLVASSVIGTPRTLTVATLAAPTDIDFRDITAAGASSPWSGTRLGNCLGNTNITFVSGANKYWNLAAGGSWNAAAWATSSGGTAATTNFPLAQDTAIIENTGLNTSATITMSPFNVGTINMSTRSNAMTLASSSAGIRIYGNLVFSSAVTNTATSGGFFFHGQGVTQQLTAAGITLAGFISVDNATGILQLQDNLSSSNTTAAGTGTTSSGAISVSTGTLDLNEYTITLSDGGIGSNALVGSRTIDFGSAGKIVLQGNSKNLATIATTTILGTPVVELTYSGSTGTRSVVTASTGSTEAERINLYVKAGSDIFSTVSSVREFRTLDFTGFTGSWINLSANIHNNLILGSGMTVSAGTTVIGFIASSATQQITTNGVSIDRPITVGATGTTNTLQLQDNLTMGSTRTFTLTAGTLDLSSGNRTLSTGIFSSSNSNTRSIAFGTGKIVCTGNNINVLSTSTATNFSHTGTSRIELTYSGSVGTRALSTNAFTTGLTEANSLNVYITAGTDIVDLSTAGTRGFKTLDFTGFSGSLTANTSSPILYGNLIYSTGMTLASTTAVFFLATSGIQQITTNGKTLDFPITQQGIGGTVQLQDNLTIPVGRTYTLTNGTIDINGKVLSVGNFSSSNSNTRVIDFGLNGELTVAGVGTTAFNAGTSTGLSFSGTGGKINMSGATAKTFAGGGATYLATLSQSGLGDLTITGANTFDDMTNTVQPCTIIFPASTTTSFKAFNVNGTAGNLVSLRSSTSGTRYTLAKVA